MHESQSISPCTCIGDNIIIIIIVLQIQNTSVSKDRVLHWEKDIFLKFNG